MNSPDGAPNRFMRFGAQSGILAIRQAFPHCAKSRAKRAFGSMRATMSSSPGQEAMSLAATKILQPSIFREHPPDLVQVSGACQCEHEQEARLLRIERVGGD